MPNVFGLIALIILSSASASASLAAKPLGLFEMGARWKKSVLTTCWADDVNDLLVSTVLMDHEYNEPSDLKLVIAATEFKSNVETAVISSFAESGIQFVGWKSCAATRSPDVILAATQVDDGLGVSAIGDPAETDPSKKTSVVWLNAGYENSIRNYAESNRTFINDQYGIVANSDQITKLWIEQDVLMSIVHEFGHIAGLHHEHYRRSGEEDFKKIDLTQHGDTNAKLITELVMDGSTADVRKIATPIGKYDLFSNMSYEINDLSLQLLAITLYCKVQTDEVICNEENVEALKPQLRPHRGYFSEGDLETLQFVYRGFQPAGDWIENSRKYRNWLIGIREQFIKRRLW